MDVIIELTISALGLLGSKIIPAVTLMSTIEGFQNNEAGRRKIPVEWGHPWGVWMQAGLDGTGNTTDPNDPHLIGAGGPFPNVYLFNDVGHFLGTQVTTNPNAFVKENTVAQVDVYPNNVKRDNDQDATFALLSARDHSSDGILVVEIGFGAKEAGENHRSGPYHINGFTIQTCGAPWYPSGVYRQVKNGTSLPVPGVWLGGDHGLGAIQIHGPSHMAETTKIDIDKFKPSNNVSIEDIQREFCMRPARLSFWKDPVEPNHIRRSLITDLTFEGDRTLSAVKNMTEEFPGSGRHGFMSGRSNAAHRKTLSIVSDDIGLSATDVCRSTMSFGPDYVNVKEGMFCRMEDRTLLPLCPGVAHTDAPVDDKCFDMDSKQVVDQRTLQRLRRREHQKLALNGHYDSEWRSSGSGWERVPYEGT